MTDQDFKLELVRESAVIVQRLTTIESILKDNAESFKLYASKLDNTNSRVDTIDKKVDVLESKIKVGVSIFVVLGPILGGLVSSLFTKLIIFK